MEHKQGSDQEVIRVLVADSTRIHTQLLADALKRDPNLEVVGAHSTDLIATATLHHVDVAVVSSHLDEDPLPALKCYENFAQRFRRSEQSCFWIVETRDHFRSLPSGSKRGLQPTRVS